METRSDLSIKLSPRLIFALIVVFAAAVGGLYIVKPELAEKLWQELQNDTFEYLSEDRYLPQMRENLEVYLRSAVIRSLAARSASQAEFDAIGDVQILATRADPWGYYAFERDFWMARDLRRVSLEVDFEAGGQVYQAEGEFTVDGVGNRIVLSNVDLVTP